MKKWLIFLFNANICHQFMLALDVMVFESAISI